MNEETNPDKVERNWKLTLSYDGTDFRGWQVQPGERTVQGELQSALGRICGELPLPQGSGRTDAGVHALGQVASFQLTAPIPAQNLQRALNRTLPASIRVLTAEMVPAGFHARHSAIGKIYEYRVFREAVCPPALARYVHACAWPLQFNALEAAAQQFVGTHDFLSFAATDPELTQRALSEAEAAQRPLPRPDFQLAPPVSASTRTLFSSQWIERDTEFGALLVYRVRGSGFLHHMVRNLVGTMLDVGRGRLRSAAIPAILAARDRAAAGPTAPAQGLFLHSVEYDAPAREPATQPA